MRTAKSCDPWHAANHQTEAFCAVLGFVGVYPWILVSLLAEFRRPTSAEHDARLSAFVAHPIRGTQRPVTSDHAEKLAPIRASAVPLRNPKTLTHAPRAAARRQASS